MLVVRATAANVASLAVSQKLRSLDFACGCVTLPGSDGILQKTEVLVLQQIAVLNCHEVTLSDLRSLPDIALPSFAALRHLILSTAGDASADLPIMKHAIELETLSLGILGSGINADWSCEDVDVSALRALKHVRIEDFAPRLYVPDGCLLHFVWDADSSDDRTFLQWIEDSRSEVQSLWQSNRLGSLQMCIQAGEYQSYNTAGLRTSLTCDQELAYISLCSPELGSEMEPFTIDPGSCQMLALAERAHFRSEKVCNLSVTGMQPGWKDLSIDAA